jgi:nitrogen regulatory protein P-II 1
MLKIEIILGENDVMAISEGLKKIGIGGLTVSKVRGRGKKPGPEMHASKGSEIFTPQFTDKYKIEAVIPETKEDDVVNIIKANGRIGKIFISQILRAIDISTTDEGDETIWDKVQLK